MTSRILVSVFVLIALLTSCRAIKAPAPPLHVMTDQWACKPDVIAAMKTAWEQSGAGTTGTEAGFRIDFYLEKNKVRYTIVPHDYTNEQGKLTIDLNPFTVAEFHIHPNNSGAAPSTPENNFEGNENFGDTKIADDHLVDIYTYNTRGLYLYKWETKQTTLLRENTNWTTPCVAPPMKRK